MDTDVRRRGPGVLAAVLASVALLVVSCTGGAQPGPDRPSTSVRGPAYTLRVLAGSELDDMKPILAQAARATGVTVRLTEMGTLDGARLISSGMANGHYDASWFATNQYVGLQPSALDALGQSTSIMYSPVVLGVRASTARALGWDRRRVPWTDIASAAAGHRFTFGMTNPAHSNSGFSALVSIAEATANTGGALTDQQIVDAQPALRGFFGAQVLTAASSGWLADAYQRRAGGGQPVDGLVNYESVLLSLNASGARSDPLTIIHPDDGVVLATYPLTLLTSAPDAAKAAYRRLVDYLRTPAVQRDIMNRTYRRPSLSSVPLSPVFGSDRFFGLPFPATTDVVTTLLDAYFNRLRRPARTVYVLDLSGSMAGTRVAGLRTALDALTGAISSQVNHFDQLHEREQVTLLPFATAPGDPTTFDLPASDPRPVLARVRSYAAGLRAHGDTAIYDALVAAYRTIGRVAATDPNRITSIVLLTDGQNNTGRDLTAFRDYLRHLAPQLASVPVFTVLLGGARISEMRQLSALTGGLTFDARHQSLATVFKDIRGYQ